MRCPKCDYQGFIKEFEQDAFVTSSSGQHSRICPRCGERTYFTKVWEQSLVDEEIQVLLQKVRQIVDSGDFDIPEVKEDMKLLHSYKSFRYGIDIFELTKYVSKKIEEAGG